MRNLPRLQILKKSYEIGLIVWQNGELSVVRLTEKRIYQYNTSMSYSARRRAEEVTWEKYIMRKRGIQLLAVLMSALMIAQSPGVSGFLNGGIQTVLADTQRPATVNATTLNVRSGPGTGNSIVRKLSYGTPVVVVGETRDSAGTTWYKIRFTVGSETKEGYASSSYIKFPTAVVNDSNYDRYLEQQGFPESYRESLQALHAEHPTWVFQAQKTGLDWNDVIANESKVGANLVANSSISSWKSTEYGAYDWNRSTWTGFDGASWVAASEAIVSYYMDPRNFLNDTYIFQFLNHNYDSAHQTREGLQSLVSGTFLEKAVTDSGGSESTGGSTVPMPGDGSVDYSKGPGAFSGATTVQPGEGSTGGPGSAAKSGSGGDAGGSTAVQPQSETQAPSSNVQQVAPGGSSSGNVSLEGPPVNVGARDLPILAVPSVEYGPGMDASSITGDNTGASNTSPVPQTSSYVDIIMKAAAQSGVNPYVLGAMIIQEQGKGTSGSISGKTSGYEGYYNFFNVGAYQAGSMSAVTRGLWYASQSGSYGRPWNSIERSIVGGALYYGENYVKSGQDTFYLKKFNVQGSNLYKHQYMTNVEGAAGEGAKLARAYTDTMKKETLVFKIPVFNNMPETACAKPTVSGSPNNKLSTLSVTGYALTPTFNMNTESYDIIVNPSVERIAVSATAIDSKASVGGVGTVNLQSGNNTISVQVQAENGDVRTYKLNVVRQSNAPTVNVPAGSTVTIPSGNADVSAGPGAFNNASGSTNVGASGGPGSTSAAVPETQAPAQETTAAPNHTAGGPGSSQTDKPDVQIGVGPGGALPGQTGGGVTMQPETTAPAPQPPAATEAPTQAPTEAPTEPQTQASTQAETQSSTQPSTQGSSSAQTSSLKKGDCNGDGKVTVLDLVLIRKQIQGQNVLSGAAKTAADLNGDGKITAADATALQNKILGQ